MYASGCQSPLWKQTLWLWNTWALQNILQQFFLSLRLVLLQKWSIKGWYVLRKLEKAKLGHPAAPRTLKYDSSAVKAFDSFQGKIAKWEWEVKNQEAQSHYRRREILQLIPNCLSLQIFFHFFRSWLTVKLGNIWRQLSRKASHSGEMKNTLIASHLAEKQSTGRGNSQV